jgi:hypothetical protein
MPGMPPRDGLDGIAVGYVVAQPAVGFLPDSSFQSFDGDRLIGLHFRVADAPKDSCFDRSSIDG